MHMIHSEGLSRYISALVMKKNMYSNILAEFAVHEGHVSLLLKICIIIIINNAYAFHS